MERLISSFKASWNKPLKCELCGSNISKSQLSMHFKYCTSYFNSSKFKMGIGDYMMLQRILKQKIYHLKLISHKIQKNPEKIVELRKIGINLIKYIPFTKTKGWENDLVLKLRSKFEKWSRFNSYSSGSISQIQEIIFYTTYKDYDPYKRIDITSSFNREYLQRKYPNLNLDRKISFRSCSYSEDSKYSVLSDCSRIYVFDKNNNELLCRINDNIISKTTLIEKYEYLIYQNKDYSIVFFNLINKVEDAKIELEVKTTIKYLKVTSDSKFLVIKINGSDIQVWDVLSRILCHSVGGCEEMNFVISNDNFELLLFDSDIRIYNFFCNGKGTKMLKNDKKITELAFVNKYKLIYYADGESLKVVNYLEFSIVFNCKIENQLFYLTKDCEYLLQYSGKCFEFKTQNFCNSTTFAKVISNNPYGFFPSNYHNIYYSDTSLANNNQVDKLIANAISFHKLIDQNEYIEKYVLKNGYHFLLYLKKDAIVSYIFITSTAESIKSVKMIEFDPLIKFKYLNNDFFVLESKTIFYFWSLELQKNEYCMKSLKKCGKKSMLEDLKNFALSKDNRYAVFPNNKSTKVNIIKMSSLYTVSTSDTVPVVDTWQNYLGFKEENQIKVFDLKLKTIISTFVIEPESLISFKIFNSNKLLLVFKSKIKLIELLERKVLASGTFDSKIEDSEPHYEIRPFYVAVSYSDNVFIISLKNNSVSMIKLPSIKSITSFDIIEEAGFLAISGLPAASANHANETIGQIILVVALDKMKVVKKLSSNYTTKPAIYNDLIVLIENSNICAYKLSCNFKRTELKFEGYNYHKPLLNNKYLTFIKSDQLLVLDLLNNFNQLTYSNYSPSYFLEITKNEQYFLIIKENALEIYDPSLQMLIIYIKYYSIKYKKMIVLENNWVILYNSQLKFKILDCLNDFSCVTEIKVKNEPPQDVEISMFAKFVFIGGNNFFVLFDKLEKTILKNKVNYYELKEDGYVIYKNIKNKMKCLNLNTGTGKTILNRNSDIVVSNVLEKHNRLVVYEASSRTGSLDLIS